MAHDIHPNTPLHRSNELAATGLLGGVARFPATPLQTLENVVRQIVARQCAATGLL